MAARLSPKPPVPDVMRKLPSCPAATLFEAEASSTAAIASTGPAAAIPAVRREERRAVIAPLSEDTFTVQFTATRALRDKLQQAKDLLRHRVPNGELAVVVDKALEAEGAGADCLRDRVPIAKRSPRRLCANAHPLSGRNPPPLPLPQRAGRGAVVRSRLHGAGTQGDRGGAGVRSAKCGTTIGSGQCSPRDPRGEHSASLF
jgi:hypothetical protein